MRFYGWTWDVIMGTPLKLFWTLLGTMYRLQAQENLRWAKILSIPNMSEEGRNEFISEQIQRMGTIQISEERDTEGLAKLKNLM